VISYIITDDGLKNKETGEVTPWTKDGPVTKPLTIIPDIQPHMAPRGFYVSSRSSLKDLEARHDLVPYERVGHICEAPTSTYNSKDERWQEFLTKKSRMVAERAGLDPKQSAIERQLRGELAAHKAKTLAKSKKKG
jgi:hypothetical protein